MKDQPLPYVPISPALKDSKRFEDFVEFAELHDDPFAEFYIIKLLLFAGRARIDGNLGAISPRKLAKECVWQGDPYRLVEALTKAKWLVVDDAGNYLIEGWERHGGRVLKERLRWRRRHGLEDAQADPVEDADEPKFAPSKPVQALRGGSAESPPESARTTASPPVLKVEGEGEGEEETKHRAASLREYKPGEPVTTVEQLTEFVATERWGTVLSPNHAVVASKILKQAPMTAQELAYAASVTNERAKKQDSRPSVGLFLAIVKGERANKPVPGSEHEAVERSQVERAPPRRRDPKPKEDPGFTPMNEATKNLLAEIGLGGHDVPAGG